jgi:hypothetical protein
MMTYRLQGCKKSAVIGWMAGMLLLAGCTEDKLADTSQGEMLPEGKYPMTFTVTGLEATATTRGTVDGYWEGKEEVAVQVGDVVKKYVAVGSGESATLKPADPDNAFYWQSTNDTKQVSAWYLGTGYNSDPPTKANPRWKWSVQSNQNDNNGYQKSDFLYAPQITCSFGGTSSLAFSHKTAKVVINIRKYGVATDDKDIESITIRKALSTGSTAEKNGELKFSGFADAPSCDLTPCKLSVRNENVNFEANKPAETALASYKVLVIPFDTTSPDFIEIKMKGYAPFKYNPTVPDKWEGGMQYTYNLTIKGKKVTATVTSTGMTWEDGGNGGNGGSGGNGSVEI